MFYTCRPHRERHTKAYELSTIEVYMGHRWRFAEEFKSTFWSNRLRLQNTPSGSLQRVRFPSECPVYDTKQSDGEASVML